MNHFMSLFRSLYVVVIFCSSVISMNANSGDREFREYAASLSERLLFDASHVLNIASQIRLSQSWMPWVKSEATYNGITNTISLHKKYLVSENGMTKVRAYRHFSGSDLYLFAARSSVVFHELSHADFDVNIEGNRNLPINALITKTIPAWFKKHYPRFNAKTATQELFGYTAAGIVEYLDNRILSILTQHGVRYFGSPCFKQLGLENLSKKLNLDKKLEFKSKSVDEDFIKLFSTKDIYINGNHVDVRSMPEAYSKAMVSYFVKTYKLPKTVNELISRMNSSHYFKQLESCYSFLP